MILVGHRGAAFAAVCGEDGSGHPAIRRETPVDLGRLAGPVLRLAVLVDEDFLQSQDVRGDPRRSR